MAVSLDLQMDEAVNHALINDPESSIDVLVLIVIINGELGQIILKQEQIFSLFDTIEVDHLIS